MFGLHAGQFERLAEAGMEVEQVHILRQIFTNPNLELAHAGSITLTGEVTGGKIRTARWAKCVRNWNFTGPLPSLGGEHGYVMAKECENGRGYKPSGQTFKVFLPVAPSQDPNVEEGDIIMFFQMPDGSYMAPGYGDNRIGTVMMGVQGDKKVKGWGVMNGTNNAKNLGGSGIDARDKFLRQWTSQSQNKTTGGSATGALDLAVTIASGGAGTSGAGSAHTHSISTTGAHTHTVAGTVDAPHPTHAHSIPTTAIAVGDGSSGTVTVANSATTGTNAEMTHSSHSHTTSSEGNHTHSLGSESSHTHSTPAHTHTASVAAGGGGSATAATVPPFVYVAMLERLNNSGS